ncbi:hypothetical protein LTR85_009816 [Meristemomyces frigidus]|nr:hypothetical protein LTR85_009816 [Meristemomyces frigidus]
MEPAAKPGMRQGTLRFGAGAPKANTAAKRKATDDSTDDRTKRKRAMATKPKPQRQPNRFFKGDSPVPGAFEPANNDSNKLRIEEEIGDIFNAPPNTLIIHACNCEGSWGAGIAKAFADNYPAACDKYADHCDEHADNLFGHALLIPPSKEDDGAAIHFVGCLFTSRSKGRKKDTPTRILGATGPAMRDLLEQVREWNAKAADDGEKVGEVRMCQINSGLFNVPWKKTRTVLEGIEVGEDDDVKVVKVVSRE